MLFAMIAVSLVLGISPFAIISDTVDAAIIAGPEARVQELVLAPLAARERGET